jgi:hypothetical protein
MSGRKRATKFRWHRERLDDSMKTVVAVNSMEDLIAELKRGWPASFNDESKVTVEKYGDGIDERIGWDTHIVMVDSGVAGMTDGPL